MAGSKDPRPSK